MNELLRDFLAECSEQLESVGAQLARLEGDRPDARIVADVFRLLHTLKGASGFLNLPRVERIADAADTLVSRLRDGAASDIDAAPLLVMTVERIKAIILGLSEDRGERPGDDAALLAALHKAAAPAEGDPPQLVDSGRDPSAREYYDAVPVSPLALNRLAGLARELAFTRNRLSEIGKTFADPAIAATLEHVSAISDELRDMAQAARTFPAEQFFSRYQAFAQGLARDLGKTIECVLDGGGARIDRSFIEAAHEPLTALIRNALVHGVEPPEERLRLGKPEIGVIAISAAPAAGAVTLIVTDDGRGFDPECMRQRLNHVPARQAAEVEPPSQEDPASAASDIAGANGALDESGCASGLDRAVAAMARIGGAVSFQSTPRRGSAFALRIPTKLAYVSAVIVAAAGERMAVLRGAIVRSFEIGSADSGPPVDSHAVSVIETPEGRLPIARLDVLATGRAGATAPRVVLHVQAGGGCFAIGVDEIVGFEEILLEPVPPPIPRLSRFSGVAALNDGTVAMVLDAAGLASAVGASTSNLARVAPRPISRDASSSVIVFRAGGGMPRALPIASEARILRLTEAQTIPANPGCEAPIDRRAVPMEWLSGGEKPGSANTVVLMREGEDRIADGVGPATEIVDPHVFLDRRKRRRFSELPRKRKSILLIEPEVFFRDLLTEALIKRGFQSCALSRAPATLDVAPLADRLVGVLIDLDAAAADEGAWVRTLRAGFGDKPAPPLIGLASHAGGAMRRRASALGLNCVFGKFDRFGLFSALAVAQTSIAPEKAA